MYYDDTCRITLNGKSYFLREDGSLDNTAVKQETP